MSFDLPDEHARARSGDRDHVMVGIRPERVRGRQRCRRRRRATSGVTFTAKVDVIEWLGNEQYAYIPYDAPRAAWWPASTELERELDSERMRSQLVVALDPTSRIHDDSDATLWLDPRRMLIFDPQSGDNLTLSIER